jgi:hypothetical protein
VFKRVVLMWRKRNPAASQEAKITGARPDEPHPGARLWESPLGGLLSFQEGLAKQHLGKL